MFYFFLSLLLPATSVERNQLKLQECNLLRRTEMGHEWTSSLCSTNRLCSSHTLRTRGGAFLPRTSAFLPKPRTNTTFIFRHNGALPSHHEIAFYCKASRDMRESTQCGVIWMWSKEELKFALMARDTYWRHIILCSRASSSLYIQHTCIHNKKPFKILSVTCRYKHFEW